MIDSNENIHYIHSDHLNTPKVMTDTNQQVVWKGDYSPFGEVEEIVSTVEMNLRFPGQYYDAETGLNYNYFRSYNPSTGRYTQSDPIGLRGGLNRYIYGDVNPVNRFDDRGLCPKWQVRKFSIFKGYYCEPMKFPDQKPARYCPSGLCAAMPESYNTQSNLWGCTAKCAAKAYAIGWVPQKGITKGLEALPEEIAERSVNGAKRFFILLFIEDIIGCFEECEDMTCK